MLPWLTCFKLTSFALGAQTPVSSLPLHSQAQRASVQELWGSCMSRSRVLPALNPFCVRRQGASSEACRPLSSLSLAPSGAGGSDRAAGFPRVTPSGGVCRLAGLLLGFVCLCVCTRLGDRG